MPRAAAEQKLTTAAMPATRRNSRLPMNQRRPSRISTSSARFDGSPVTPGSAADSGSARKRPRIRVRSPAARVNPAAAAANATAGAAVNSAAPTGGPTNSLAADWVAKIRPFARSRSTSSIKGGRIAMAALSASVSAMPTRKATV